MDTVTLMPYCHKDRNKKTATGRLIYPIADLFIVQWKEMLKLYPKAVYGGSIYK